jgi:hypothetical protein
VTRSVHVGFVVDKVALGQRSHRPSLFSYEYGFIAAPYSFIYYFMMENGPVSGNSSTGTVSSHHNSKKNTECLISLHLFP